MFSITQKGKKLSKEKYSWDEKTKTFSSEEDNLLLDFSDYSDCTFNTGSYCTFKTGSYCTFNTGWDCTFDTESDCFIHPKTKEDFIQNFKSGLKSFDVSQNDILKILYKHELRK